LSQVDFTQGVGFSVFQRCNYNDKDFCLLEDERTSGGVYVDLLKNPERFTGYAGDSSAKVWKAIYQENCFDLPSERLGHLDASVCKEKRIFYKLISGKRFQANVPATKKV
jgi:hypothetical protein